jgi:two-component system sensor histidine kinase RegB
VPSRARELDPRDPSDPRDPPDPRHATNLAWLLRLRWVALATQSALVIAARLFLHADLSLVRLAVLGLAVAASNVLLTLWSRRRVPNVQGATRAARVTEGTLAAILAFDLVVLTALLVLTGGPFNPFSTLYLVQVALAPVVLGARRSWLVVALAIALFGGLFLQPGWLPTQSAVDHATQMRIHLQGMWLAFAVSAVFVGYFVRKVRSAMDAREAELAEARARASRDEKLAALATLAAGAAHELATPLSTIAVAAKELERRLLSGHVGDDEREDARLIREQVERCRAVLEQMSADAGGSLGEAPAPLTGLALLTELAAPFAGVEVRCAADARDAEVRVPRAATVRALRGLVKNACEAARSRGGVVLELSASRDALELVVRDDGPGIASADLGRIGEPFFTTKEAGAGMGLGVFLARAVVERLGGSFAITSAAPAAPAAESEGTRVTVRLPRARADGASAAPSGRVVSMSGEHR